MYNHNFIHNYVPYYKSFQSELHERAWYLQQKQPVESNNEIDQNIKKKKSSAKFECPSEVVTKSFEDKMNMISNGLIGIGFILLIICGLVALVNFVIIVIHPTIEEHQVYLDSSRFVTGSLVAGTVFLANRLIIANVLLFLYILPKLIISKMLELKTCAMKPIKLCLKHYLNNLHLYCKPLNTPK